MVNLSDLKRVSWQCVHFTLPDKASSLKDQLASEGFLVKELDSSLISACPKTLNHLNTLTFTPI